MTKLINITLLCFLMLLGTQAYAARTLNLNPNESKLLTNKALWTVNANCSVQSDSGNSKIVVRVLSNKSKVNGRSLAQGQTVSFSVKNNQSFSVSAEPGAKVNLTNMDSSALKAVCT